MARQTSVSSAFFSWALTGPELPLAACGVSDDETRVFQRVSEALLESGEGASAEVTKCWLSSVTCDYVYGSVIARAHLDAATPAIVWTDL